jgi:hypothetical protein
MALDYQDNNNNNKAFTKNNNEVIRGEFSSSCKSYGSKDNCNTSNYHSSTNRNKREEILPPSTVNISFDQGLDYILSHFEEPIWPRTISTHATKGAQILVYSKEQAVARYKQANLLDCRINAYPDYTEYKGINRQAPNFLFLDLDRSVFESERAFNTAFNKTLREKPF